MTTTQSGIPSFSRPADPRPRLPEGKKLPEYRPGGLLPGKPDREFHEDCGICAASGAHSGPHVWMGLPEH